MIGSHNITKWKIIYEEHKDKSIIDEMISKVDYDLFKTILNQGQKGVFTKPQIDMFLKVWAINKLPFYKKLGGELTKSNNMSFSEAIDFNKTINDMKVAVEKSEDLSRHTQRFFNNLISRINRDTLECNDIKPENMDMLISEALTWIKSLGYHSIFMNVNEDFHLHDKSDKWTPFKAIYPEYFSKKLPVMYLIEKMASNHSDINVIEYVELFSRLVNERKKMKNAKNKYKLTKIISSIMQNNNVDMALSKAYQNLSIKGNYVISINPTDYLMISMNHHGWSSCARWIKYGNGSYSMAPIEQMADHTSIVTYFTSGKKYHYDKIKHRMVSYGQIAEGNSRYETTEIDKPFDYISFQKRQMFHADLNNNMMLGLVDYCNIPKNMSENICEFVGNIFMGDKSTYELYYNDRCHNQAPVTWIFSIAQHVEAQGYGNNVKVALVGKNCSNNVVRWGFPIYKYTHVA